MSDCKWIYYGICLNKECPICSECCPVVDSPGVCRFEDRWNGVRVIFGDILKHGVMTIGTTKYDIRLLSIDSIKDDKGNFKRKFILTEV